MEESDGPPGRPARRAMRFLLAAVLVSVIVIGTLWLARRPIATRVIDRELARAGVPARYKVADLGLGRQRLTDVVIGDPARPDLVADWIETGTRLGWDGASVTAIRASRVRLRGRLVGGRVSLGALDRLLPAPSGKPFALPRLHLDVADARMRLETVAGVVGLKLSGRGRLDDGFAGRLAAASERMTAGGCSAERMSAAVQVRVSDAAPAISGPVRALRLLCTQGQAEQVGANVDLAFTPALDAWNGSVRLATGPVQADSVAAAGLAGTIGVRGSAQASAGRAELVLRGARTKDVGAGLFAIAGDYRVRDGLRFAGQVHSDRVVVSDVRLSASALTGTPVEPIGDGIAVAVNRAVRSFGFDARLMLDTSDGVAARLSELSARSASGVRLRLDGGEGVSWSSNGIRLNTQTVLSGGGLPTVRVSLDQAAPGGPVRGVARIAPYAANGASLALTPVAFTAMPGGATRITTTATLSGPLGDGRVDGLRTPVTLVWDGGTRLTLNPSCEPVIFQRLAISGLTLSPVRLNLCPIGGALLTVADGRVGGGARIAAPRLAGRLGATPVTLAASGGEVTIGSQGFALRDVEAMIGNPGRVTRIAVGRLQGQVADGGLGGRLADAGGQIANVPLLLSDTAGSWRLAKGVLTVNGAATVADAEARRFQPLRSEDLAFRLADNGIAVTGSLIEPATRSRVAEVRIAHDLSRGVGDAVLTVAGIGFDERLQPEALTRLTFGVIADVRGRVTGQGRIAWTPDGVTSTGEFRTEGLDFAAAFGPVTGLAGAIRFDDLLALRSAPGQIATVATINPGIPVTDGVIRYRTLPDTRIQVESGRWPFAGGVLALRPTLLDFSRPTEKRLTFQVTGMAADQFLQQFDFDNLNATGVFDGVLPMVFDERGGRIEGGRLTVRPGGGTLAYVGTLTQEQLGFWGDLAFQALKSIRYRDLGIVMNGPLAGEMVTEVRFAGVSQGEGAKSSFLVRRLQRLPFVFNIRIKAPFRGLIDSAQSFYDPKRLIQRNLPALLEEQNKRAAPPAIQPPASEIMQ